MVSPKNTQTAGSSPAQPERILARPVLIFDGACGFCTWTVDFIRYRLREPVVLVPWQRIDVRELGLTRDDVERAAWWIDIEGKKHRGHEAVSRALTACRPPWRTVGIVLSWPVMRGVSALLYRFISRNRRHLPGTTPALQRRNGPRVGT